MQISNCRAFEEGDPYEKICFEPKMEGFRVKYKKWTFLNWWYKGFSLLD
jgi:hypothetical protein